jgi:hypothetical protein
MERVERGEFWGLKCGEDDIARFGKKQKTN